MYWRSAVNDVLAAVKYAEMTHEPGEPRMDVTVTPTHLERARRYASLIPVIFSEELAAERISGALNAVGVVLDVQILFDESDVRRKLLSDALADQRTAGLLASLDPTRLADGSDVLTVPERAELLQRLGESLSADWATRAHQKAVIDRIAFYAPFLDNAGRAAIRKGVIEANLAGDFWLCLPLAQADVRFLPTETGQAALAYLTRLGRQPGAREMLVGQAGRGHRPSRLGQAGRGHRPSRRFPCQTQPAVFPGPKDAPFEVLRTIALAGGLREVQNEIVPMLTALLLIADEKGDAMLGVAEFASSLRPALEGPTSNEGREFVDALSSGFAYWPGNQAEKLRLLQACGELLDVIGKPGQDDGKHVVAAAQLDDDQLASYVITHSSLLLRSLRPAILGRLHAAREGLKTECAWPVEWDEDERPSAADADQSGEPGARIAAALGALDRTVLAKDAVIDSTTVATPLNDWVAADPQRQDLLDWLATQAGGPALDDLRGVHVARIEDLAPEDPSDVDPTTYVGRVVLTVSEAQWLADPPYELIGEHHTYEVAFLGRVTLSLIRNEHDEVVCEVAQDLEWADDD